jgi:predicted phosphate transport protein (TIGR00153 family)
MLEKLMPRSDEFFDDFDRQAAATVEGVKLLKALLDDYSDVPNKVKAIKDAEHRCDEITHHAYERLHRQFITPFDRAAIHRLLSRTDDVLDLADAAAERMQLYEVGQSTRDARALADILVLSTQKMQEAIRALRTIKKPSQILEACKEINRLENEADNTLRSALAKLFKSGSDPLTVMKWKEIYDLIETATDRVEDVANVIEGVVLEHA